MQAQSYAIYTNFADVSSGGKMTEKKYLKFIAYLQIIGIFLVVVGHSFHEYPDGDYGRSMLLYRMMHSFRMPLFMFVSGFLMVYTTRSAVDGQRRGYTGTFVSLKLRRLLLPFAVLTLITFVPRAYFSPIADETVEMNLDSLIRAFVYPHYMVIPYLWFLQASFTLLVVCFCILVLTSRLGIPAAAVDIVMIAVGAALLSAASYLPSAFSLAYAGKLAVFFVLGIVYARNMDGVDVIMRWTSPFVFMLLWAIWVALFFALEGSSWMPLCSVAGIGACISGAKILEERRITLLDPFFGANYMIFLLSWYFNVLSQQVLGHFVRLPWQVHTVLSLLSGIFVPYLFYRYMQRHPDSAPVRLCAFLLGQSLKRR